MPNNILRREIGKSIFFNKVTDSRFKLNRISICFLAPMSEITASENALVPRVLTRCCAKYPTNAELSNKLCSLYAARLGNNCSNCQDAQMMTVSISCIDDVYALDNEHVSAETTDILLECLFNPLLEDGIFSKKIVERQKQMLIDDIEAELNDKIAFAKNKAKEQIFAGEPAAVFASGDVERVRQITPQTLFNAYKRMLERCRIEIICVGNSNFEDVRQKLTDAFAKLERGNIFPCETKPSSLKQSVCEKTDRLAVTQSKLVLGLKTDCKNYPALMMFDEIFGGDFSSMLFKNVREKMSLCYYCSSGVIDLKGTVMVQSGVENENINKAREAILAQLAAIQNGDFTDDDIHAAKMSMKNRLKSVYDRPASIASWYLGRIYRDDIKTPEEMIAEYEKVTKDEIVNTAKTVKLDTVYVLTSLDEKEGE